MTVLLTSWIPHGDGVFKMFLAAQYSIHVHCTEVVEKRDRYLKISGDDISDMFFVMLVN